MKGRGKSRLNSQRLMDRPSIQFIMYVFLINRVDHLLKRGV
jgi:hypothetical protein